VRVGSKVVHCQKLLGQEKGFHYLFFPTLSGSRFSRLKLNKVFSQGFSLETPFVTTRKRKGCDQEETWSILS